MSTRFRSVAIAAATTLVMSACGGGATTTDTTAPPGTITTAETATTGEATATTTTPETPATVAGTATTTTAGSVGHGNEFTLTIDGTSFELSVAKDIPIGQTGVNVPTRCEPDPFGAGRFWVIAVAVDEEGSRKEPPVTLTLDLPHEPSAGGDPAEFRVDDESGPFEYLIASDASVVAQAGEYAGEVGTWMVEGNRISGEVTVYEYDHVREYSTATFDITCPAP